MVLPPKKQLNHERGHHSFEDFFDLDAINAFQEGMAIITMDEFLAKEVRTGHICTHNATTNGCGEVHREDLWYRSNRTELYNLLESIGQVPRWNSDPPTCALVIPDGKNSVAVVEKHPAHPANDVPLCTYDSTPKLLHLSSRILSPHYSFFVFEDEYQDLFAKRLVRNFLRYNDDIICAAARVVEAIRSFASDNGVPTDFYSMHIRRGDFSSQYPEGSVPAADLVEQSSTVIPDKALVYIATDEKDKSYFKPFQERYTVVYLDNFLSHIEGIDDVYFGMIEQLVASKGKVFFGTWPSTFSSYINRLRGFYSVEEGTDNDGVLDSLYFSQEHMHDMMKYKTVEAPSVAWLREYPDAWFQIDR